MNFFTMSLCVAFAVHVTMSVAEPIPAGDVVEKYYHQDERAPFMSAITSFIGRMFEPFTNLESASSVHQMGGAPPIAGGGGGKGSGSTGSGSNSGGSMGTGGLGGVASTDAADIFPTALYSMTEGVTGPTGAIELLHNISTKQMNNEPLTANEAEIWAESAGKLKSLAQDNQCHLFLSSTEGANAYCCEVLVDGEAFALCTMESFLPRANSISVRTAREEPRAVREATEKEEDDMETGMNLRTSVRVTLYIDLFNIQCDPPIDDGLCSQYCCDPGYANPDFCNSDLQCY